MKCTVGGLSYMCSKKCEQKETCRSERKPENSAFTGNLTVSSAQSPSNLNRVIVGIPTPVRRRYLKLLL